MKLAEEDLDQSYFQSIPKSGDSYTSYLLATVVLFFFFSLFLFGMHRTQSVSDQIVGDHSQPSRETEPEIGDTAEAHNP